MMTTNSSNPSGNTPGKHTIFQSPKTRLCQFKIPGLQTVLSLQVKVQTTDHYSTAKNLVC